MAFWPLDSCETRDSTFERLENGTRPTAIQTNRMFPESLLVQRKGVTVWLTVVLRSSVLATASPLIHFLSLSPDGIFGAFDRLFFVNFLFFLLFLMLDLPFVRCRAFIAAAAAAAALCQAECLINKVQPKFD